MTADILGVDCQRIIAQLMERHDWRLLEKTAFSRQLCLRAEAARVNGPEALTKLAVNLYCETWHAACRSSGDRRTRAYTELAHYLYDRALYKYGERELAEEIVHDAIVLVYEQIDHCQNPGAFMAFALLKLWNAATAYFRRRNRQLEHRERLAADGQEEQDEEIGERQAPSLEAALLQQELATTLLRRVGELMQAEPRAQKQYQAVLYKFLYSYSDQEIADQLGMDVASIHVLRSRGLKRLRKDAVLRHLAQDFLE